MAATGAVVSTVRLPCDAYDVLHTFIDYHVGIGFNHVYLFYDDVSCPFATELRRDFGPEQVTTFTRSDDLMQQLRASCSGFPELLASYDNDVPSRQLLHAQYARILCETAGVEWLVHLDVDELFYLASGSLGDHWATLDKLDVHQMVYENLEGIPEEVTMTNYFDSVSLFKRNYLNAPVTAKTMECMQFLENRTTHGQYMLCYDNGKSAVRVSSNAVPRSVHEWKSAEGSSAEFTTISTFQDLRSDTRRIVSMDKFGGAPPVVLHFVNCGLNWLTFKYKTLGAFKAFWLAGKVGIPPCFHLDCRDAFASNGVEGLETIYRNQVLLQDKAKRQNLVDSGLCVEVHPLNHNTEPPNKNRAASDGATQDTPVSPTLPTGVSDHSKAWILANVAKDWL